MEYFKLDTLDTLNKIQSEFDSYQQDIFPIRTPEFFCLELNGEAGELANAEKKLWKGKNVEHYILEDEAADVFIALMNYSNSRHIELGKAVKEKLIKIEEKRQFLAKSGEDF
ncbi:MAG: hypothetical protein A2X61_03725 [Ignavibacteria bacterium GWB2_35_12]|nr:MAG: hypothetical protein A2X63_00890 [Ignavibacteria bacterium GWA2_35_8]OGU40395.1 MAG: hypothetical protein A2X61_03725 [Ignavibacteria bacterium GWB2_35_12]OGU92188.1 MAG: hypothetical protein A2220_13665 [Ignavibacteria bacterium RIFOXYA2_FULL_35_10]OGV22531.1 MAG: hypothetical protein A2475_03400 [Ignavibacteria bacterium RIFOXYC2_FULL_35_21]